MRKPGVLAIGIITCLFCIDAEPTTAQIQSVKNFTTQDGLPSIEVFHIFQDRNGFLWFSTSNGIASFDGKRIKAFSVDKGVPDPLVLETQEDHEGRLWMRAFSGRIGFHLNDSIFAYPHNDSLSSFSSRSFLEAFAQDSSGRWVYYEGSDRSAVVDSSGRMHISDQLASNRIVITQYPTKLVMQNSLREKDEHATATIDGKDFPITVPYLGPKFTHMGNCIIPWRGNLYFSHKNYLFRYDGKSVKQVLSCGAAITNLSVDAHDRLYIGHMNHGVIRFTHEGLSKGDTLNFTRGYSVTDVLEDHEGGLWVSTAEAGVFYLPMNGIHHYHLTGNHRIRTALVHREKILIGTYDGTLMELNVGSGRLTAQTKFDNIIMAIHAYYDTVFAGTSTGLYVLRDIAGKPVYQYPGTVQNFFEQGNHLVAITNRALVTYRTDGGQFSKTKIRPWIRRVYPTDSINYAITNLGLELCDQNFNTLSRPSQLNKLKLSQLHFLGDSLVLVGTLGSGLLVADTHFKNVSRFPSLPRDIYSIVELKGYYYFASEQAIFRISLEDIVRRSGRARSLNSRNGLLDQSISQLSKTADGKLAVFYDRSFSIVDPTVMDDLNQAPRFYLSRVLVNNRKMPRREAYRLPYDSNTVQLEFGFLSFNNQDIDIRYRLKADDSWIYPPRTNILNLYALSPGIYLVEMEYSVDRVSWQRAEALPTFDIDHPLWQNPYLQLLVLTGLCIVAIIIVRGRIVIERNRSEIQQERNERLRILTVQQQQLIETEKLTTERERNRIAQDLHDGVGASLLATKLSVSGIFRRYNHEEAVKIEQQLATTLNEIKNIIYDLSPTELERQGFAASIKSYVDKLSGLSSLELDVAFYGEDITESRIVIPVFRIIQELLSNSIKHSDGDLITVHINSFPTLLNIVYEDNGQGFSPTVSRGTGRGLVNIELRVEAIGGCLRVDSGDYGTTFIIDIPLTVAPL